MTTQLLISGALALAGIVSLVVAVTHERKMQRHRLPGVTYGKVTLRRDGGWRRDDLFDSTGLAHQRQASRWGITGAGLLVAALATWVVLSFGP